MDGPTPTLDVAAKAFTFLDAVGLSWVWVLLLAIWGGTASYVARVRRMKTPFSLAELVGEWTISGFAGVITGYLCMAASFPPYLTVAFAGISGHMGGKAIALMEGRVSHWLSAAGKIETKNEDHPE